MCAIYFGILTFKDSVAPVRAGHFLLNNLLLVIVGLSILAIGVHWSITSGDVKNTVLLIGGSLFAQGVSSVAAIAGEISGV
ncbi:MAG: hypothetical protein AB1649_26465 [Chloroflexota bacterium]